MRALLFTFLLAAGCATAPPTAQNYLAGTNWLRVDDEQANPHGATLSFESARASGHTGCNRWFGAVSHDGEALRFGDIGMTRMACVSEMQAGAERRFLDVLSATRYAHYDRDVLVLLDERQNVIARFNRAN